MTFTLTYIDMMKGSPMQKEWKPKVGDWVNHSKFGPLLISDMQTFHSRVEFVEESGYIWLPTSDDWWEKLNIPLFYLLNSFQETVFYDAPYYRQFNSLPELLSAFYHKQRWGMRWENNQWRE